MNHSTRKLPTRQRTLRGITVASVGVGIALGAGAGIAAADPASPGPSPVNAASAGGLDAASVATSIQHQAADARAKVSASAAASSAAAGSAQAGSVRPAAATPAVAPRPAAALTGQRPNTPATPVRDAIAKLQKQARLLNQLTGGKLLGGALGGLFGPASR